MLVSSPAGMQRHQRQHRRQNSIPVALEAAKVPLLPTAAMLQRYSMHKRGTSLGQPANLQPSMTSQNQYTNTLREQQQTSQLNQQSYFDEPQHQQLSNADSQRLETRGLNVYTNQYSNENSPVNDCMSSGGLNIKTANTKGRRLKPALQPIQQHPQRQQQCIQETITLTTGLDNQLIGDGTWNPYIVNQSMLAQMYDLRRASVQSDISQQSYIPSTPPKQVQSNYVPITPDTTPFRRGTEFAPFMQNFHTSPVKNIVYQAQQPIYMQRTKSLQGVPGSNYAEPKIDVPSPPNTAPVDYDCYDLLTSQESDFESTEFQLVSKSMSIKSEDQEAYNTQILSATHSFQSSPEIAYMPLPSSPTKPAKVPISTVTPSKSSPTGSGSQTPDLSPNKPKLSPKVASIDSLNLDSRVQASITETGITIDEIAAYISGPDPVDGKWVCIHPGCDRRFGRKENIKSHIQTHLGDRQYKCDHCDKCFVRGHDLKRHAKIHTGDKPYECLCGNVFARHDALTRHRQRGMCIGGYKGVVRKTTKRGRPKKSRPDMEERQDKAARTRERISARSGTMSVSGSDSSCSTPPSDGFESMSIQASSPLEDMAMFQSGDYCLPSEVFSRTPPASPGYSTGHNSSPAQTSRSHSPLSDVGSMSRTSSRHPLEDIAEEMPDLPPISEAAGCFDPEPESSMQTDLSSSSMVPALTHSTAGSEIDIFINNNSSFSDFGQESGISNDMDLFSGKSVGVNDNDFFLDFNDDHTTDSFFQ
ncbi:C2H2 transcription factor Swi5 [Talaromyces stipitatus ATCC 10500]|uniref:C2H2 type master regulator of conidiophore development brlA n=1 Tax=Talaromyces stipitatus (strain ATCC 10500 / CBS 375.48 / QM 6759 / NRRL 1006) TaxID=441959 RepID=B8M5N5_TALSN|nr:C2H2 transcription factor Swi5 [Talaromyces stipitatus ATCC 10500]EED19929.1 C2H2 transcription factor Swi5 [Talaromyces stipitatus ATCC 10500]